MNLTTSQLQDKLYQILGILSVLDPKVAVAAAGINELTELFTKTGELSTLVDQVFAETQETAPEVAKAVADFYKSKGDALEASFKSHPGK